jgi:hypothetical protein
VPSGGEGPKLNPGTAPAFLTYTLFVELERAIDGVGECGYSPPL